MLTQTSNWANKKLVLHVRLRCGSLSITTPVSFLSNLFDVRSVFHGQVSLAAVYQVHVTHEAMNRCKNLRIRKRFAFKMYFMLLKLPNACTTLYDIRQTEQNSHISMYAAHYSVHSAIFLVFTFIYATTYRGKSNSCFSKTCLKVFVRLAWH